MKTSVVVTKLLTVVTIDVIIITSVHNNKNQGIGNNVGNKIRNVHEMSKYRMNIRYVVLYYVVTHVHT